LKLSLRAGSILTACALSILGCDPAEPLPEESPKHGEEKAAAKHAPETPVPAVEPAPKPLIPASANPEEKPAEKKDEAKPEPPKE
jgi:hypothetical protein